MDNQQHYGLTSDQIQVILTGTLGDGCVVVNSTKTKAYFQGSSIVESLAKISYNTKKDGKSFPYLRIGRHNGSKVIAELLQSYPVRDMMYKSWCSQTIQEWSKLEAELKSDGKQLTHRGFTDVLNRRLQDIVESA